MSSFAERVKLLLQKRLDAPKWPVGDTAPGGIRYLSDGQGNMIALLTTSVNPNDAEPIGPGSAETAAEQVDPFLNLGSDPFAQLPLSMTQKASAKEILIGASINTTTNTIVSLEDEQGVDYSVPASKETLLYKQYFQSSIITAAFQVGYADDGVAEGTTDPTTPVFIPWFPDSTNVGLHGVTVDVVAEFNVPFRVPTGKFPFFQHETTSGVSMVMCLGVEYNA